MFKKAYLENDVPSMAKPKGMLDHHPHRGFPQHGGILDAPKHMRKTIWKPANVKAPK